MGQYYMIVNITKREYLDPQDCTDGLKLMEFGLSAEGTMSCLAILLADGNGNGGGDLDSENPIIGSWAGDKIVITGDYADEGRFTRSKKRNLYAMCDDNFRNVSEEAMLALTDDDYVLQRYADSFKKSPYLRSRNDTMKKIFAKAVAKQLLDPESINLAA